MKIRPEPIGAFDPLLRDLLLWELVEPGAGGESPRWQLSERAQSRLDDLVVHRSIPSPDRLVYLDHRCAICGGRKPTRLRDGGYVCDPCTDRKAGRLELADRLVIDNAQGEVAAEEPPRGRHARRRGRNRTVPPVAS